MPIFEFQYQQCGHKFDLILSNANKDKAKCPQCGAENLKQLLSSFSTSRMGNIPDHCCGCSSAGTGRCKMGF